MGPVTATPAPLLLPQLGQVTMATVATTIPSIQTPTLITMAITRTTVAPGIATVTVSQRPLHSICLRPVQGEQNVCIPAGVMISE